MHRSRSRCTPRRLTGAAVLSFGLVVAAVAAPAAALAPIVIDTFSDGELPNNEIPGFAGTFDDGVATISESLDAGAVRLDYNVTTADSFAGYFSTLESADVSGHNALRFRIKGALGGEVLKVELADGGGNNVPKLVVGEYLRQGISTSWKEVTVPLVAFTGLADLTNMATLVFVFENTLGSGSGTIWLDDLSFVDLPDFPTVVIDNYNDFANVNALGGGLFTAVPDPPGPDPVQINAFYDTTERVGAFGAGYTIQTQELDPLAVEKWAVFGTHLLGVDATRAGILRLAVRGHSGGELFNLELISGTGPGEVRGAVNNLTATTSWQTLEVPLTDFTSQGVDLSDLRLFQVVFGSDQPKGTISIDDVELQGTSLIFTDGFESGDVSAWSNSVGVPP